MNYIIAIVGLCGSGKSIASNYFVQKGFNKIHFGQITLEKLKKENLKINETNEKYIREKLRQDYGMDAYAKISLQKIENLLKKGSVLIDGLYSFSEYTILKEKYKSLILLCLFTPKKLRYKRLSQRKIRTLNPEEAYLRDIAEIKNLEKGGPIAIADYTIINNGNINLLKKKLKFFEDFFLIN